MTGLKGEERRSFFSGCEGRQIQPFSQAIILNTKVVVHHRVCDLESRDSFDRITFVSYFVTSRFPPSSFFDWE